MDNKYYYLLELLSKTFLRSSDEPIKNVKAVEDENYHQNITKLKTENEELSRKLKSLQKMLDNKIDMEAKVIELEKKCEVLKDRCKRIEHQNSNNNTKPLEVRAMEMKINKLQEKVFVDIVFCLPG